MVTYLNKAKQNIKSSKQEPYLKQLFIYCSINMSNFVNVLSTQRYPLKLYYFYDLHRP